MANAEGDDDVEDVEPQDIDNEGREMNDWAVASLNMSNVSNQWGEEGRNSLLAILQLTQMDKYKSSSINITWCIDKIW